MATKKRVSTGAGSRASKSSSPATPDTLAYEKAVAKFGEALTLMQNGQYEAARAMFTEVEAGNPDEQVLGERSRTYASICAGKLSTAPAAPADSEQYYLSGVVNANNGEFDEAIRLLNQAVADRPASGKYLYARAAAFALKGTVEAAIDNLRQAISADPATRFLAVNDPDFEEIREEPAFIDIIEPTPSGG